MEKKEKKAAKKLKEGVDETSGSYLLDLMETLQNMLGPDAFKQEKKKKKEKK